MTSKTTSRPQFLLLAGHIIECFDNTLYGFFAVKLAPLFFPTSSEKASLLASYGAFAAGFLARPLGAIFFGHLGDISGRRTALLYSMALVGIPTFMIGSLPSYETLGLLSPLLLLICRLAQGFLMGGEFTGANLYISENSTASHVGKGTGLLIFSGVMGAVFATLVGTIVTLDFMPSWSWRLPFLLGGVSAFLVYILRRKMTETLEFEQTKESRKFIKTPWKILLSHHKSDIIAGCFISGLTIVPLYCATILGTKIFKDLGYSSSQCMSLNTFGMVIDAFAILYFGYTADRIGFHRQMLIGTLCTAFVAFFAFSLVNSIPSVGGILGFIFLIVGVGCIINGCGMPYIASYFPVQCRFSGMALSVTLGHALFGGTTPLIGAYLMDYFHSRVAPAYWIIFVSVVTFLLLKIKGKPLHSSLIQDTK